jgi:hypothetical protein
MQLLASAERASIALGADLDPALLAFVKCHVTSPLKWEALRWMAEHPGCWVQSANLARALHKSPSDVERTMSALAREGAIEERLDGSRDEASYRLPDLEPTTVVIQRLIQASMRSQELRSIIAAHLLQSQHANGKLS